jgi:hypothetical protein
VGSLRDNRELAKQERIVSNEKDNRMRTVSERGELRFSPIPLEVVRTDGYTVRVSADDSIVVFMVLVKEICWIFRADDKIVRL